MSDCAYLVTIYVWCSAAFGLHWSIPMENPYRERYRNRHTLFPVLHGGTVNHMIRNTKLARDLGCDGVFLVNHDQWWHKLLDVASEVAQEWPDWFVGVNCLELDPTYMFRVVSKPISGVWVDHARIDERQVIQRAQVQDDGGECRGAESRSDAYERNVGSGIQD